MSTPGTGTMWQICDFAHNSAGCLLGGRRIRYEGSATGSGTDVECFTAMLWDLFQHYQINQLDAKLDRVQLTASESIIARDANKHLVDKVEFLALVSRALFELLEETTGVSEDRLRAKITEIDLRDGQADGRMTRKAKKCPKCDAMMSPRFGRCLFC